MPLTFSHIRIAVAGALCFLPLLAAQEAVAAPPQYAYRILFTDKAGAPPLSDTPAWLSARAMARRAAYDITLDATDRPVSPAYLDTVLRLTGGHLHVTSRWLNQCVVLLTDSSKMSLLAGKPFIRSTAWVGYFPGGLHTRVASSDNPKNEKNTLPPKGAKVTGTQAYYGAAWSQTAMVNGDYLHDLGYRGQGQIIAVIDEGFSDVATHPGFDSMRAMGRLLETYDFVHDTAFVFTNADHGTQSLSTIAGLIPGTYVGSAPRAAFALYTTEDGDYTDALYETDNLIAGIERADSLGADVISCSLGYNTFTNPYTTSVTKAELNGHSTAAAQAVNLAVAKGIFYVSSAGNEGGNGWDFLLTPSDADSALTVGSVMGDRAPSSFSSPGPNASGRVKPDVCLQGGPAAILSSGGTVTYSGGTSFSAPQAAGYAACLKGAYPGASPARIRAAINRSADRANMPTAKLGYGIPDFKKVFNSLSAGNPVRLTGIDVYPNPFSTTITILLPDGVNNASSTLRDVTGRSVGLTSQVINGSRILLTAPTGLARGLYVLEVRTANAVYVQKLLHN